MPVHEIKIDAASQKRKLFFGAENPGRLGDFETWVAEQAKDEQKNLLRLLRICLSHTNPRLHHSDEKFKKEFDNKNVSIWAIKSYQIRLLGVTNGYHFHIIHFLRKKTNKLSKEEIKTIKAKHNRYIDDNK